MKKTQRITSLLLALVLAAGLLLPAVPSVRATDGASAEQVTDEASPAQAAGGEAESAPEEWAEAEKRPSVIQAGADEMPDIVADDDGYIHSFVIKHAYTRPGDFARFYGEKSNTSLPVGVDYYDFGSYLSGIYKPDNHIDFNGKLIEKDTGREVDISKTSTETIQRKDYTLRISVTPGYGSHPFSQTQLKFADDLQVYLRHHTDSGFTERYTYLPAAQICHGERPFELWVEFDLDYSYSGVYTFEKKGIGLLGDPVTLAASIA